MVFVGKLFQWTCDYIIARLMADSFSRLSLVNFECLLLRRMVVFHMRHSPEKYLTILPLRCTLACKSCIRDHSAVHQSQERRSDRWKERARAGAQPHESKSPSFNDRGTELVQRYSSSNSQGFKGHIFKSSHG